MSSLLDERCYGSAPCQASGPVSVSGKFASRSGIAQPAIARLESGATSSRGDTLDRLLGSCGWTLQLERRRGAGLDRSVIRNLLRLSPRERLDLAVREANNLDRLLRAVGKRGPSTPSVRSRG